MSLCLGRTQPKGNGMGTKTPPWTPPPKLLSQYLTLTPASHPLVRAGVWDPYRHRLDLENKSWRVGGMNHRLRAGQLGNLRETD